MKNHVLILLIATCSLLIAAGCASGASPTAYGADDLDMAIRDASDYLNDNIPAGSKIVILNMQSNSAALSDYIIDELIANAVNNQVFSVVDRAQLDVIRQEQNFQWAGEVSDETALSIGNFVGAQTIVSGRISELGDRYRLTIRALEVQTAQLQGQYNRNMNAGRTIAALIRSGGRTHTTSGSSGQTATQTTAQVSVGGSVTALAQTAPTAPTATGQTATLANGTYTFWPRPRAKIAGMPSDTYLIKVEVNGRYMIIYITGVERGIGSGTGNRDSYQWQSPTNSKVLLTNLDRPSQTWEPVSRRPPQNTNGKGLLLSFEGVTATRFSLEALYGTGNRFFRHLR